MAPDRSIEDETLARLDALEAESRVRRDELRSLVAALPAATSRRAYLSQMVRGVAVAPDRADVARRVVAKALRTPIDLVRRSR